MKGSSAHADALCEGQLGLSPDAHGGQGGKNNEVVTCQLKQQQHRGEGHLAVACQHGGHAWGKGGGVGGGAGVLGGGAVR